MISDSNAEFGLVRVLQKIMRSSGMVNKKSRPFEGLDNTARFKGRNFAHSKN